jgi:hypothetical protein
MDVIHRTIAILLLAMIFTETAQSDVTGTDSFRGKTIEPPTPYIYPMKTGPGFETVQKCSICHSYGYILDQGKVSRSYWEHETHKMVASYNAPITPDEEKVIVDYLTTYYGNGK